jgi:hypothetical protein
MKKTGIDPINKSAANRNDLINISQNSELFSELQKI